MSTTQIAHPRPTSRRARLTTLVAAAAAAAALSVASAGPVAATTPQAPGAASPPPVLTGSGCLLVQQYLVYNPSMNKPRGHQDVADGRSWADGCP